MSRCPRCSVELEEDRIGGVGPRPGRAVLLCPSCWAVFPCEQRPRLHLVVDERERRDLA
jgi:hypothetical protein